MAQTVAATDVTRFTVYHSPETPGYTCWAGALLMPDGTLMVTFNQATGPLSGRPGAPPEVLERLSWPPAGKPGYDMTGTIQQNMRIVSTDGGETWQVLHAEPWHSPMNGGMGSHTQAVLPDGTIVRGVWGQYLPFYDVPQTGYVQRSADRGRTWSAPQVVMDPDRFMVFPKRLRPLRDGRLAMVGGFAELGSEQWTRGSVTAKLRPSLWLSADGGRTWAAPIATVPPREGVRFSEESDFAELPDGRLLFVHRASRPQSRWQSLLEPDGEGYRVVSAGPAPFPHSGCPEVLWAREGVALHLATSGISWTADAGESWRDLDIGGTGYYPSSVQLSDGRIFCVFHRGSDNPYDGSVDQEIQAMTFRLTVDG
ncbi:MAG: sialidase family protein [Armatimonadota bacterium]